EPRDGWLGSTPRRASASLRPRRTTCRSASRNAMACLSKTPASIVSDAGTRIGRCMQAPDRCAWQCPPCMRLTQAVLDRLYYTTVLAQPDGVAAYPPNRGGALRVLGYIFALLAAGYLGICALLYAKQDQLLYPGAADSNPAGFTSFRVQSGGA